MIEIMRVAKAFGIRGVVRVVFYVDDLLKYDYAYDELGTKFKFKVRQVLDRETALVCFDEIHDRNKAEKFCGTSLYIKKDEIKNQLAANEFYMCDLIGSKVLIQNTNDFCIIKSIQNYGAGDLLELSHNNKEFLISFVKDNFPDSVDGQLCITQEAFEAYR